jgi:hypothetical protein
VSAGIGKKFTMTSPRRKLTSTEKVAIITGIFTIIAAIIAGIFSIFQNRSASMSNGDLPQPEVRIIQPKNTSTIDSTEIEVIGTHQNLPVETDTKIWIFVVQSIGGENPRYWLQRAVASPSFSDNTWQASAFISASDVGKRFEIYAVAVNDPESNNYLQEHMAAIERGIVVPFLGLPPLKGIIAKDMISVTMGNIPAPIPASTENNGLPTIIPTVLIIETQRPILTPTLPPPTRSQP